MRTYTTLHRDEAGATATEYLMLVVLVALAIIVGVTIYGQVLNDGFSQGADQINDELSGGGGGS